MSDLLFSKNKNIIGKNSNNKYMNVKKTTYDILNQTTVQDDDNQHNNNDNNDNNDDSNQSHEWKTIKSQKSKRNIKKKHKESLPSYENDNDVDNSNSQKLANQEPETSPEDTGSMLTFKHSYKVWVHDDSKDWKIDSFDKDFFVIDSVATFLQFFNNFYKFDLNVYSFYIMKSLIEPTWEHEANRNGGICSLRIDTMHGVELLQQLSILMVNECLVPDMSLINGISIGKKNNWILIKIWTNDKDVDISKSLPNAIINSYSNLCIKSKANMPEY
jgi:hypothetical protein